jgi:hypothetical protein
MEAKKLRDSGWLISAKVVEINHLQTAAQVEEAQGFSGERSAGY